MLHVVATLLRINLQEARSGFGLFGRYSYSTVLVMEILNVSGIRNGQNPVLLGNAVQRSHQVMPMVLLCLCRIFPSRLSTETTSLVKLLLHRGIVPRQLTDGQ